MSPNSAMLLFYLALTKNVEGSNWNEKNVCVQCAYALHTIEDVQRASGQRLTY